MTERTRRREEGARAALPRRREPARRDRPAGRARARGRRPRGRAPASACSPPTSPSAWRTFTRSSSTTRSSRVLAEQFGERGNVELSLGDALRIDLGELRPAPTKLVANLPYNIATPLVVESLDGLPTVQLWCVMVQREVADRFFAQPSTKAYGAVSVRVQLAAERTGFHPVSRTVFRPRPNVDSALVAFRRRPADDSAEHAREATWSTAAFAHRRKTLANSLELAGVATRDRAAAGARGDRPRPRRPRRGARPAGVRGSRRGAGRVSRAAANAKLNLALVVGPRRADGRHEVATVLQRLELADGIALEPAPELRVDGFRRGHARATGARGARRGGRGRAALEGDDRQGDPGRGRARRRQLRRCDGAAARQRDARRAAPRNGPARARRRARRGRPVLPRLRPAARRGRRRRADRHSSCRRTTGSFSSSRTERTRFRPPPSTRRSTSAAGSAATRSGVSGSPRRSRTSASRAISRRSRPTTSRRPHSRSSCSRSARSGPTSRARDRPSTGSSSSASPPSQRNGSSAVTAKPG